MTKRKEAGTDYPWDKDADVAVMAKEDLVDFMLAANILVESLRRRYARELRAVVEALPEPTLGLKGGVSREAVLALLAAGSEPGETP